MWVRDASIGVSDKIRIARANRIRQDVNGGGCAIM
jgi:hypothetical protein